MTGEMQKLRIQQFTVGWRFGWRIHQGWQQPHTHTLL